MQISITGRHLEITQGLRDHINERINSLGKHFDRILDAHIVLMVERENQIAEATVHIPHQPTIHAKAETTDMYASVDMMVDKIRHQMQKQKGKEITERDHRPHGADDGE